MENVFKIHINGLPYQDEYKEFKSDLHRRFFTKICVSSGEHLLLNTDFELFIQCYIGNKMINWDMLCSNSMTPWSEEILIKYSHNLNWKLLIKNSSISWNLNLIKKCAGNIDFGDFYKSVNFEWDIKTINELKDWVYFSIMGNVKEPIKKFTRDYYSFIDNYPYRNLSSSDKIIWSNELIEQFKDCWAWDELCANKNILWTHELIIKYEKYIDFDNLCLNDNVDWSLELIEKYQFRLNWIYLSRNPKLPWSTEFIINNESRLFFGKEEINVNGIKGLNGFNLSENQGIHWTLELFERYINKIDIWQISLNAKIEKEVLIKYHQLFDEKRYVGCCQYKYSDWYTSYSVYLNCWQNLIINPNMDTKSIEDDFFKNKNFKIEIPIGNLANDGTVNVEIINIDNLFKNGRFVIKNKVINILC